MTYSFDRKDLETTIWDNRPAGGMHVGTPKGVKVLHMPTGNVAICMSERSQHKNRSKALDALEMML